MSSKAARSTAVGAYEDFGSVERMAAKTGLSERQIRLALAYRERFPDEVNDAVEGSRRPIDELWAEFPTFDVVSVRDR